MKQESENNTYHSSKAWMVVAIVAVLALIGVCGFGYYKYKAYQSKVGSMGADINSLNAQVAALNAQVVALQKNATDSSSTKDAQQIVVSSASYCVGANMLQCNASVTKQLDKYADVTVQGGVHLLLIKDTNNNWPVILSSPSGLCNTGVDGPNVVAAINALCGR